MKFIEKIVDKLLVINYEDFTQFSITALSIADSSEHFDSKDLERIKWIVDNVHEDLQTSIYKLDRFIDPNKVSDDPRAYSYPIPFKSDKLKDETGDSKKSIKISSEDLQKYLCNAVQEINTLLYRNLNRYNEDFVFPNQENTSQEDFS